VILLKNVLGPKFQEVMPEVLEVAVPVDEPKEVPAENQNEEIIESSQSIKEGN
jgi:hypothetical protein